MGRNHFWIFMIAGVAFGLCMEVMKHVDLTSSNKILDRRELVADDSATGSGYGHTNLKKRIQAAFPKRRDLQQSGDMNARIGGLAPDWGANDSNPQSNTGTGGAQKQGEQKPKTAAELKKEKEDAEKKKKEEAKKKKKKKKKKKVPGQPETKDSQDSDTDDEPEKSDGDGSANATADMGPEPTYGGAALIDPSGIPQTLEEWEAYVLRAPDFKRTSLMIRYYQTSLVKPDIFYEVVAQMVTDSRQEMRSLGVMALGQAPSARSFVLLVSVLDEEKGNTTLKTQVRTYMKHYTQLQNLKYLANAMSIQNAPRANHEALRLFRLAADYHLKPLANQQPTDPNDHPQEQNNGGSGSGPRQPATSSITRYFDPFVNLLTSLAQASRDASFRQEANVALDNLQALLAQRPA